MDSWTTAREVEKVKPSTFVSRAEAACRELGDYSVALAKVVGRNSPVVAALDRAEALLTEAIRRGVKGKDAAK